MALTRNFIEAYYFFRAHAGYIVGRSAECAFDLAQAEQAAELFGWTCTWEYDEVASREEGEERLGCVLRDENGDVCDSLWAIGLSGPRDPEKRVIEAQLAITYCDEHRRRLAAVTEAGAAELAARATYAGPCAALSI